MDVLQAHDFAGTFIKAASSFPAELSLSSLPDGRILVEASSTMAGDHQVDG